MDAKGNYPDGAENDKEAPFNEEVPTRVEFNFRGVGLELEVVKDGNGSAVPIFVVSAVYHNGVDMTEAMAEMIDVIDDRYNEVVRDEFMEQTRD